MKNPKYIISIVLLLLVVLLAVASFKEGSYVDLKIDQLVTISKIKQDPDNPELYIAAGVASYGLKEYPTAEKYYTKAIALKESALAHNNLGNTYRELQRFTDAEKSYQKAIELAPTAATSYLNLANLYKSWPIEEGDKKSEAEKVLNDALAKTNRNINILYALIDYYRSVGEDAKADKLQEEVNTTGAQV